MTKRVNRESSISPLPMASPSPKSTIHNKSRSHSSKYNKKKPITKSSPPSHKTLTSITDLKDLASSRLDDMKRNLIDRSHSEILKDLEASHSRLHKRFKIQSQACQQVMDEAEKDYKKMTERIGESQEAMKASYAEFMADAQATASRLFKISIPELSKSFEKAIDVLQGRFGVSST